MVIYNTWLNGTGVKVKGVWLSSIHVTGVIFPSPQVFAMNMVGVVMCMMYMLFMSTGKGERFKEYPKLQELIRLKVSDTCTKESLER